MNKPRYEFLYVSKLDHWLIWDNQKQNYINKQDGDHFRFKTESEAKAFVDEIIKQESK